MLQRSTELDGAGRVHAFLPSRYVSPSGIVPADGCNSVVQKTVQLIRTTRTVVIREVPFIFLPGLCFKNTCRTGVQGKWWISAWSFLKKQWSVGCFLLLCRSRRQVTHTLWVLAFRSGVEWSVRCEKNAQGIKCVRKCMWLELNIAPSPPKADTCWVSLLLFSIRLLLPTTVWLGLRLDFSGMLAKQRP